MIQSSATTSEEEPAEMLKAVAQGDAMLRSVAPVMRHLLTGAHHVVFADESVARVRGTVSDIARQLLDAIAEAGGREPCAYDQAALDTLFAALVDIPDFVGHAHSIALEWQVTERLQRRLALDPALPPLLQALLASNDPTTSALAMNLLAAQARFVQAQRRMQLPLGELPADLLHDALLTMPTLGASAAEAAAAEARIRAGYHESRTRLGLIARVVTSMGGGAVAALSLTHAGVAIFATALGLASGQDRDAVVLSASEEQAARFALTLRSAGLNQRAIHEQLLTLGAEIRTTDWDRISADRARMILDGDVKPAVR